jgi:hypothetical protein
MKIISSIFLLILCSVFLMVCDENGNNGEEKSDTWEKALKGYSPAYIEETGDGGFIIAACSDIYAKKIEKSENSTNSTLDICLIKTDKWGREVWRKNHDLGSDDYTYSFVECDDGGFLVVGSSGKGAINNFDIAILKTDSSGNYQWSQKYNNKEGDWAYSVAKTMDGGYIIAGSTNENIYDMTQSSDLFLLKIDASGEKQWLKTYGGEKREVGRSVLQTNDGGFIVAGSTCSYGIGAEDVYLLKTDQTGTEQWYKTFGGNGLADAESIKQTIDGGYIIAGSLSGQVYLIKTDADGDLEWSNFYGAYMTEHGHSVCVTSDGGYAVVGSTESYPKNSTYFDQEVYMIKTDSIGGLQWTKTFGGTEHDWGISIQEVSSGGYVIVGGTASFSEGRIYFIRTDENGNVNK